MSDSSAMLCVLLGLVLVVRPVRFSKAVRLKFVFHFFQFFPASCEASNSSCATICPAGSSGFPFDCIGTDSGGCCAEHITQNGANICAHSNYCMVSGYTCCGCQFVNTTGTWECGGCPSGAFCVSPQNNNGTRIAGTSWYCNSGTHLAPNLLLLVLATLLASLCLQYDRL